MPFFVSINPQIKTLKSYMPYLGSSVISCAKNVLGISARQKVKNLIINKTLYLLSFFM